jgi:peptidoglycan/LPS O-acetylase OafA/YrhL
MILATLSAAAEVDPALMPFIYRFAGQHPLRCWLAALAVYALACLSPLEITYKVDYPGLPAGIVDYWLFVSFAVLIVAPLTVPGAQSRFINVLLGNRVMRYYGKISYSVFLWHVVVYLLFVVPIFGPAPAQSQFWPVYLVELAFSTVVAIISYYVIERPFHKLRPWLGKAPAKLSVEVVSRDDFSQPTEPATVQTTPNS